MFTVEWNSGTKTYTAFGQIFCKNGYGNSELYFESEVFTIKPKRLHVRLIGLKQKMANMRSDPVICDESFTRWTSRSVGHDVVQVWDKRNSFEE
jgi:hypothetical protein